jgi:triose/dihydroxyacetone kinase / FAD-AMP lyase (cyclizing)
LNMPGFSITLLLLPSPNDTSSPTAKTLLSLLDEETDAPGWNWSFRAPPFTSSAVAPLVPAAARIQPTMKLKFPDPNRFADSIQRACRALIAAEAEITRFDNIAGDADCGLTLKVCACSWLFDHCFFHVKCDSCVGWRYWLVNYLAM